MKVLALTAASALLAVAVFVLVILSPLSYAFGGFLTGWILGNVFQFAGLWVVDGSSLLGLKLTLNDLQYLGAFLGFVGAFFRSSASHKKD